MNDANSVEKAFENAPVANSPELNEDGTQKTATSQADNKEAEPDYKKKFGESSAEALRLLEEGKAKDAEIARLQALTEQGKDPSTENLYPDFDQLDPEAQANLIAYTKTVTGLTKEELYKDPAIAFAKQTYNEKKWEDAFGQAVEKFPELKDSREEFRSKYFNPNVQMPDNIGVILEDLAKVHLFDKAREIGASEERTKSDRIDQERATGGDKTPVASRTTEEWHRLQQENPAEFAKQHKQFRADMEGGKLPE